MRFRWGPRRRRLPDEPTADAAPRRRRRGGRRAAPPLLAPLRTRDADGQVHVVEVPAALLTHSPREDAAQRRTRHRQLAEVLRRELAWRGATLPRAQADHLEGGGE